LCFWIQNGFMKKQMIVSFLSVSLAIIAWPSFSQIRKIPPEVTQALKDKYPDADHISWKDKLTVFAANFDMDSEKYEARFSGKGEWKSTEKEIAETELPEPVKDGFDKSKYADWEMKDICLVELPDEIIQYRIYIAKNDIRKKNLLFSGGGQLLKDNITLR
jgi:hypothetical protein